jgi:hypothetical protein
MTAARLAGECVNETQRLQAEPFVNAVARLLFQGAAVRELVCPYCLPRCVLCTSPLILLICSLHFSCTSR